jgi:hypothetical protein
VRRCMLNARRYTANGACKVAPIQTPAHSPKNFCQLFKAEACLAQLCSSHQSPNVPPEYTNKQHADSNHPIQM